MIIAQFEMYVSDTILNMSNKALDCVRYLFKSVCKLAHKALDCEQTWNILSSILENILNCLLSGE